MGGVLIAVSPQGYGFIRGPGIRKVFPSKDVYLNKQEMGTFKLGDALAFDIYLSVRFEPTATNIAGAEMTPRLRDVAATEIKWPETGGRPPGKVAAEAAAAGKPIPNFSSGGIGKKSRSRSRGRRDRSRSRGRY